MFRFATFGVAMLFPVICAHAQETAPTMEPGPRISPALGVHYGSPLRASIAVGLLIDRSRVHNDGLIVIVEPGIQGTEASAGYFHMIGGFGTGYSMRAVVLRTGDEPWRASAHTTYVGAEFHGMLVFGIGGRVGYLRRASRSIAIPENNVVSLGVSIGG